MTSFQTIRPSSSATHFTTHVIKNEQEALEIAHELSEKFRAKSIERDAERILPFDEIEAFSQSGLWAITVPKYFGGADVSAQTVAEIIALFSGVDGSIGQIPQNHFYALEVLRNTGTEQQQRRLYQEVLNGARFGNALAEFKPKNANIKQTLITPYKEGYVITGEKFYCTGSLFAHRIPTLVRDDEGREYLAFVPRHSQGLTVIDNWTGFGQRLTGSGNVKFNQVYVEAEDIIPFDDAFTKPTLVGPFAQIMHAAIEVGIARAALKETFHRVQQARPWIDSNVESAAQDPLTIYEIGQLVVEVRASEVLLKNAAQLIDNARLNTTNESVAQASLAVAAIRAHSTETALKVTSKLIELAGSRGSQSQDGLDRFWRNARVHTLHDPARWKYYFIGNHALNGTLPPRRGTL